MAKELDIPHVNRLVDIAAAQVQSVLDDAVRHAAAHLGVEYDHPSIGVIREELVARTRSRLEETLPAPVHDYSTRAEGSDVSDGPEAA